LHRLLLLLLRARLDAVGLPVLLLLLLLLLLRLLHCAAAAPWLRYSAAHKHWPLLLQGARL
jgi:hypothetical protein